MSISCLLLLPTGATSCTMHRSMADNPFKMPNDEDIFRLR